MNAENPGFSQRQWRQIVTAVFVGGVAATGFVVLVVRLYPVLWMLGVALLIAYVLDPLLERLQRRGWSRLRAVWFVLLMILVLVAGVGFLVIPRLVTQAQEAALNWDRYSVQAEQLFESVKARAEAFLKAKYPGWATSPAIDQKVDELNKWSAQALPRSLTWLSGQLAGTVAVIGVATIVALMTFHFMCMLGPFRETVASLFPGGGKQAVRELDREVSAMLGQYLRGLLTTCLTIGVVTAILLSIVGGIFGTKYGLLLGLLAGASYPITFVGPFITTILVGFLGYFTADHDPSWACAVSLGCIYITNQLGDYVLMPKIVGRRVGLHPLVIITGLLCAFTLWGIPGMLIATPTAASIKIILARWLPLKGVEEGAAPPRGKPLMLDLGVFATKVYRAAGRVTQKVEGILLGEQTEDSAAEKTGKQDQEPK